MSKNKENQYLRSAVIMTCVGF